MNKTRKERESLKRCQRRQRELSRAYCARLRREAKAHAVSGAEVVPTHFVKNGLKRLQQDTPQKVLSNLKAEKEAKDKAANTGSHKGGNADESLVRGL